MAPTFASCIKVKPGKLTFCLRKYRQNNQRRVETNSSRYLLLIPVPDLTQTGLLTTVSHNTTICYKVSFGWRISFFILNYRDKVRKYQHPDVPAENLNYFKDIYGLLSCCNWSGNMLTTNHFTNIPSYPLIKWSILIWLGHSFKRIVFFLAHCHLTGQNGSTRILKVLEQWEEPWSDDYR